MYTIMKKNAFLYTDAALKLGVEIRSNRDVYAKVSLYC